MKLLTVLACLLVVGTKAQLDQGVVDDIRGHQDDVKRIIDLVHGEYKYKAYELLGKFTDEYSQRISGSDVLEDSIDWMMDYMVEKEFQNVDGENVTVPDWIRGEASASILTPRLQNMDLLALGSSIGTNGNLTAEVLVVKTFEELEARKDEAVGKIVVYNQEWTGYGSTVAYRHGASQASEAGAVGCLVKSIADFSLYTPHTGQQDYAEGLANKIPTAAITIEDAELLQRYQDDGKTPTVSIDLSCVNNPDKFSRNVVAEIVGNEKPDEIVLFGGHIDSWDVGAGVMDDGGGVIISVMAMQIMKELGLTPRRTMRCVLWTAEEPGLIGAYQYHDRHKDNGHNMVLMSESDAGIFEPLGIRFSGSGLAKAYLEEVMRLLESEGTTGVEDGADHPDLGMWDEDIPKSSPDIKNENYFWYHHTNADTLTMMNPDHLDATLIVWATAMYVVANMEERLPLTGDHPGYPPAGGAHHDYAASLVLTAVMLVLSLRLMASSRRM